MFEVNSDVVIEGFYVPAMASIESFITRAEVAEAEIQNLLKELNELENSGGNPQSSEELEKLRVENTKLKYRLEILQNAAKAEEMKSATPVPNLKLCFDLTSTMPSLLQLLTDIFKSAVCAAFPELGSGKTVVFISMYLSETRFKLWLTNDLIILLLDVPCPLTLSAKQADYQFNGAMIISGLLKVLKNLKKILSS